MYWMDFNECWWEDVVWAKEETIKCCCRYRGGKDPGISNIQGLLVFGGGMNISFGFHK